MKIKWITLTALFAVAINAQAANPDLTALQQQLNELSAKIAQLEAEAAQKTVAPAEMVARIEELEKKPAVPQWALNTKIKGDFRYRYENREDNDANAKDRQRVRLRIGAYGKVNDSVDYGVRFVAGGGATSGNDTLGDGFDSTAAKFDLYYVDIHPEQINGTHVILGKMKKPWLGRTGLVWDGDLNPEGIAVTYSTELNENMTLHANAGAFVVQDEEVDKTGSGSNARLQSGQIALDMKVGDAKVQVGVSDYWFENVESLLPVGGKNKNNTAGGGFNIVEGFGSVSTKAGNLPVKIYGQIAQNTEAVTSDDTAFLLGFKLGKAKKPSSWELGYNYREVGKDAVVGAFNDSDFNDGNTDSRGHKFGAKYQIAKNWQAGAAYLMTEGSAKDVDTLQLDLKFKF